MPAAPPYQSYPACPCRPGDVHVPPDCCVTLTDAEVQPSDRVPNRTGVQCVFATLETCARCLGVEELYDLTAKYKGKSNPGFVADVLRARGVEFKQQGMGRHGDELIRQAVAENLPCLVGLRGEHAVTLVGYDDAEARIIDNLDPARQVRSILRQKFAAVWDGWVCVLFPKDRLPKGAHYAPLVHDGDVRRDYPTADATGLPLTKSCVEVWQGNAGGSGTIVGVSDDKQTFIVLSAAHVFSAAGKARVKLSDGTTCEAYCHDLDRKSDVAILSAKAGGHEITPVSVADDQPAQGEEVWKIGFPAYAQGKPDWRFGRVANWGGNYGFCSTLPVYSGDSGGGVFNKERELVSIITGFTDAPNAHDHMFGSGTAPLHAMLKKHHWECCIFRRHHRQSSPPGPGAPPAAPAPDGGRMPPPPSAPGGGGATPSVPPPGSTLPGVSDLLKDIDGLKAGVADLTKINGALIVNVKNIDQRVTTIENKPAVAGPPGPQGPKGDAGRDGAAADVAALQKQIDDLKEQIRTGLPAVANRRVRVEPVKNP